MLPSLQSGSGGRQGNGAGPCAPEVPGPTGEKQPESEVRAEGGVEGAASERGEDPTPGGAAACGRRPPSRGPCGAWRLPAPTSASSATAPSLGRRARDRVGPDAGYERAQQQQQHRRSGRAGGAGRGGAGLGARHCGKGVGQGRVVRGTAAGGVGRTDGRAGGPV